MIHGQCRRRVVGNCLTHIFEAQCFKYVCTLLKKYIFLWRKLSFHIFNENPREKLVNWDAVKTRWANCPLLKSYMYVYNYICMYVFIFTYLTSVKGSSNNGKEPWTKTKELEFTFRIRTYLASGLHQVNSFRILELGNKIIEITQNNHPSSQMGKTCSIAQDADSWLK